MYLQYVIYIHKICTYKEKQRVLRLSNFGKQCILFPFLEIYHLLVLEEALLILCDLVCPSGFGHPTLWWGNIISTCREMPLHIMRIYKYFSREETGIELCFRKTTGSDMKNGLDVI